MKTENEKGKILMEMLGQIGRMPLSGENIGNPYSLLKIWKQIVQPVSTLLAEAFPLSFSALYCHSLCGFGCSRFVLVVSVPRKRPLQTAVWDSC